MINVKNKSIVQITSKIMMDLLYKIKYFNLIRIVLAQYSHLALNDYNFDHKNE